MVFHKTLADRLHALDARTLFGKRARHRQARRRRTTSLGPAVAAQISLLEPRCLLSANLLGTEMLVNNSTAGNQQLPDDGGRSIDVAADGTVIAVWATTDASGSHIVGTRIDADGNPIGNEFPVSETLVGTRDNAVVSVQPNGTFVVAWESHGNLEDPSGFGIFARVFQADGTPLSDEIRVNTSVGGDQRDPSVAPLSATQFVVTWSGAGRGGSHTVFSRVFDVSGVPVTGEVHVSQGRGGVQENAAVASLPNGGYQVAWSASAPRGAHAIFTRQFTNLGKPLGPGMRVNTWSRASDSQPAIAREGNDQVVIAWQAIGDPLDRSGSGIVARRFGINGAPLGREFLVNQTTTGRQFDPSIDFLSDRSFVVAWRGNGDSDADGIFSREFNADGTPNGNERLVNTITAGTQADPTVRAQGSGGYAIAWDGNVGTVPASSVTTASTGQTDNQGIALQRFGNNFLINFAGYKWSTDYHFNLNPGTGWYNNGQQWAPQNSFVDAAGLHLRVQPATVDGYTNLSSAEVVLSQDSAGNPFNPGYGTYLVAAHHDGGFNLLGNNNTVAFGAFTYQKDADQSQINSHRELDMIEASRFGPPPQGWQGDPTNAQFTIQPWTYFTPSTHNNINVHRITLKDSGDITLVMKWKGPNQPVIYSVYYGIYNLSNLPATPNITWPTVAQQNPLVPNNGSQTVHLNLWREPGDPNKPLRNDEVIVKNFQYTTNV